MTKIKEAKCPICKKQNPWSPNNTFRPFCSERCKLIDLGEWASDSRVIAGQDIDFLNEGAAPEAPLEK